MSANLDISDCRTVDRSSRQPVRGEKLGRVPAISSAERSDSVVPHRLRFRQVHLDFHTSGAIGGIGSRFDKKTFQETLKRAAVNSITLFATCHHGWSYYDTKVGRRHPGLSFDLLRAQFEVCKELDINVPIYMTGGIHNLAAEEHPEWRVIDAQGRLGGWESSNLQAGFRMLSFHSPYLDYLCEQIQEVVTLFPHASGIFLDIVDQGEDCSTWALRYMEEHGLDPQKPADRDRSRLDALMKYYRWSTAAVHDLQPDMPVFHNSPFLPPGFHDFSPYYTHFELESLPTGGWGYDHFPFVAKYAHLLDKDFLGMTGKFHSTWGEFGGYKHPNALRYECCAMLAMGSKCSIGDQLNPTGQLDSSTYDIIGEAYREVAQKEPFVEGAKNVADVALLSSTSIKPVEAYLARQRDNPADTGAARVLLEEHFLFDVIDPEMDFAAYRVLVLPDDIAVNEALHEKLNAYLTGGGKLLLTGDSGIDPERGMLFDIGAQIGNPSEFQPDYILPVSGLRPDFVAQPMVMYKRGRRLSITEGESLGEVYDPYFNRQWNHFCSHQHTPARPDPSGFSCGVRHGQIMYLAHPVFSIYRWFGQVTLRQYLGKALRLLLDGGESLRLRNLPSTGRVTLMHQVEERRYVLHLLNAHTVNRGGAPESPNEDVAGCRQSYEVIEECVPLHDVGIELKLESRILSVRLEPEGLPLSYTTQGHATSVTVPKMEHHQMIALTY